MKAIASKLLGNIKNIRYIFKGQTKHEDISSYYQDNHVELFINSSDNEGIPVSLMEAMAVGIKTWEPSGTPHFIKPISIGKNCFIGAGSILLPGTYVRDNCIIGSHAVVKGNIPQNSIVVGNPDKTIAKTDEWEKKHIEMHDYIQ